jgi:hypothetical protein
MVVRLGYTSRQSSYQMTASAHITRSFLGHAGIYGGLHGPVQCRGCARQNLNGTTGQASSPTCYWKHQRSLCGGPVLKQLKPPGEEKRCHYLVAI